MTDDMAAYAAEAPALGDNILAQISENALKVREAEAGVAAAELALKVAQEKLRVLQEETLPELMAAACQLQCTTADGLVVAIGSDLRGSLPKGATAETAARRARGLEFIAAREPSLLKAQLLAELGKPRKMLSDQEQAVEDQRHALMVKKAVDGLAQLGIAARQSVDIHPMTLKAFARELLAQGEDVPLDDLGLHILKKATVSEK